MIVAAAGNDKADSCMDWPSWHQSVIAVGAYDGNGRRAHFSNVHILTSLLLKKTLAIMCSVGQLYRRVGPGRKYLLCGATRELGHCGQ